jgi:hypothetical protein
MQKSRPEADDTRPSVSQDQPHADARVPSMSQVQGPVSTAEPSAALVDEFVESYVFWRESCEVVSAAYKGWVNCEPHRRDLAFEDYRAALDWEELAADVHASRAARVRAWQG